MMNTKRLTRFLMVAAVALLLATLTVSVVQAGPHLQDPRPPAGGNGGNGGGSGTGGAGGAGGGDGGGNNGGAPTCAALTGQVMNWGFGPQEGAVVELKTGSWQVSATSASDGNYGMGGLGVGIATLHVSLGPGQADTLKPLVQDAGVYLNCDFPIVANLPVSSNSQFDPPATIQMSAPAAVSANRNGSIRVTVKNSLPNEISNVVVTNLMPSGLVALDVAAAAAAPQNAKIINGGADGQLVVVFLDKLAAGDEANIIITVTADAAATAGRVRNTATLFYRESAADQAFADITISGSGVSAPVVQTETLPTPEPEPSPTPAPTATPVAEPAPTATAQTGEEAAFVPPPGNMPTTGGEELVSPGLLPTTGDNDLPPPGLLPETGLGLAAPLTGIALVGLAFFTHLLRSLNRRKN